jgi:hypothetical protein
MPRRLRPAPGQLTFRFLVLVDADPAGAGSGAPDTVAVRDVAVEPPTTCQERVPRTRSIDRPSWRPRRARGDSRLSGDRRDWTVDRWTRRGAACLLCGHWPAPHDRLVRGRLVLVCGACERRPDTLTRLDEVVREDWSEEGAVDEWSLAAENEARTRDKRPAGPVSVGHAPSVAGRGRA